MAASNATASGTKPLAFGTALEHDSSRPVHAGPEDGWHGRVSSAETSTFRPEKGRYHLYVGLFCPFAHRANLVRHLKGLTDVIDLSVVRAYPKGDAQTGWPGWKFPEKGVDEYPDATEDTLFGCKYLHEVYFKADPDYKGRYSVPLLWDRKTGTIVCNESAELMRWLQTTFDELLPAGSPQRALTLYPEHLRAEIDAVAPWLQRDLNGGVYRAGFATSQEAYDAAVPAVFVALNRLEELVHANGGPFILGSALTELDILAYPSLIRFDVVYVQHFKCNLGTIRHDYPNLHEWLKNLYWNVPGFKETTNFRHIKENYTKSHYDINPRAITPMGPFPDIESGVNLNFAKLRVGSVNAPAVLEHQQKAGCHL